MNNSKTRFTFWLIALLSLAIFALAGSCNAQTQSGARETPITFDDPPMPVELMYFYGDREGDEVHFRWSTASEINNDYFTIQMSADAQEWQNILKVQGEGTTHWQVVYMAKFINPKKAYYRLFQTDLDGTTKQVAVTVVYGMDATNVRYFDLIGRETTADAPGPKLKQVNYQLAYRIYTPYK